MEFGEARKFSVSNRSLALIIALVTMLVVSATWNVRQSRLIEQQRQRVLAAEQEDAARAAKEAEQVAARRKRQAEYAGSDARIEQLYREISNLSQASEHVASQPLTPKTRPSHEIGDEPATAARDSGRRPPL